MKNKTILLAVGLLLAVFMASLAVAEVSYPVAELGNCGSEEECESYCDETENVEACVDFAEESGLMSKDELSRAKKILPYLKTGATPGGCSSREECDNYCTQEENLEECIEFALEIGDITEKEAEMARKTGGKGPGDCRGPVECDAYCNKDENIMECVEFAYEHGMIDEEEYEMVKKTGGKGPGGCRGEEECDAYCEEHKKECMEFAEEHGLEMGPGPEGEGPKSEEESCIMECLEEKGADPSECGPSKEGEKGGPACGECAESCVHLYEGPCLTEEELGEKEEECNSKGEFWDAKPIMGTDPAQPERGECIVDVECFNFEEEFGDMPGEGPGINETEESEEGEAPAEGEELGGGEGVPGEEETTEAPPEEETKGDETETGGGESATGSAITAEVILMNEIGEPRKVAVKFIFR